MNFQMSQLFFQIPFVTILNQKTTIENKKMRLKKFNPVKRVHEWFVEAKLPPHN